MFYISTGPSDDDMLDDSKDVGALDTRDLLGVVSHMGSHLTEGFGLGRSVQGLNRDIDGVVVCALGGSAIGGDLARAWLSDTCPVPLSVVRSYSLPAHVGHDTLVVIISYSGDTEETLSMAADAVGKGARTVAVSSGGRLESVASEEGMPHCRVPSGFVPRATVGYVFGALAGILDGAGVADAEAEFKDAVHTLGAVRSACGPDTETSRNPAKRLAHELHGTVPVIVGHDLTVPVARRWADQLNENAKMVAFSDELPEMDHNAIVGWVGDPLSQGFSLVFLEHDACDARMRNRLEATKSMASERSRVYSSTAMGETRMAKMFSLVMTGDYVSLYSAFLRREDPSMTEPIERLKNMLSEKRV